MIGSHGNPVTAQHGQEQALKQCTSKSPAHILSLSEASQPRKGSGKQGSADMRRVTKHRGQNGPTPAASAVTSRPSQETDSRKTMSEDDEEEGLADAAVRSGEMFGDPEAGGEEEEEQDEPAAFEVPSQMPRELQSWAWDK